MTKTDKQSTEYVLERRLAYSLYVMQSRAIPAATDGLKAGGRRVLWTARDGKHYKSATLAGATMPIHPHASPESAINTLTAPYGNNIPLFDRKGAFGTLMEPTAYAAARYTGVTVSKFTQDVIFKDIDIVPLTENYDGTLEEPVHFLPLIPMVLLNPSEGIAIGFASNVLPRALDDLIVAQISHLKGARTVSNPMPKFLPLNATSHQRDGDIYYFNGTLTIIDSSSVRITSLPYGQTHPTVLGKLDDLIEKGVLISYTDNSKNMIDIALKFKRGYVKTVAEPELLKMLGLTVRHIENLNVLNFDGKSVWHCTPVELIRKFTDWRLQWYVARYERLRDLIIADIQRYLDIRTAIKNNVGAVSHKTQSRGELKELLTELGIQNLDYIADLPIYRFTQEEYARNEQRISAAKTQLAEYVDLLESEDKRKKVYIAELQEVLAAYTKGQYTNLMSQ